MLLWYGQVPFCYSIIFKKILTFPNYRIRVKGKRICRGVGYGLEISAEYILYGNEKAMQWAKGTLDGVVGMWEKFFAMFKIIPSTMFMIPLIACYKLPSPSFCFFWPVHY